MKIVIDTNILISAVFFGGIPRKVIDLVIDEKISACMNEEIFSEYEDTAFKMNAKGKWHINREIFDRFLNAVEVVGTETVVDICRDPDDNKFIA